MTPDLCPLCQTLIYSASTNITKIGASHFHNQCLNMARKKAEHMGKILKLSWIGEKCIGHSFIERQHASHVM